MSIFCAFVLSSCNSNSGSNAQSKTQKEEEFYNLVDETKDLLDIVADDIYYFETYESAGTPVIRFRNHDEAFGNYKSAMSSAISNTEGFFYNFTYVIFEEYEVEGSRVTVTTYSGDSGVKSTSTGSLGSVRTPEGNVVRETSCYAKVKFDLKSILDGSFITKTRDIYCTLEIN